MKNLLIFLFGAAFGVGGTLLWLRKDIEKELDNIKINAEKADDLPFTVGESKKKEASEKAKQGENSVKKAEKVTMEDRIQYNTLVNQNYSGQETVDENGEDDDPEAGFMDVEDDENAFEVIDTDDFMHDKNYEKDRLVYFRGDKIMSTESGAIIRNPYTLVGGDWEESVGKYADNTAFIRNNRLTTDYEIYVEDGLYSDEYDMEVPEID